MEQPSAEETLCMLNNIKKHYESHHCVHYTEAALEACVHLTQRYVPDRFFPDKAIDVMDEAGSRAHVFKVKTPEPLASMERDVETVCAEKNRAIRMQNYDAAATLKNRESALAQPPAGDGNAVERADDPMSGRDRPSRRSAKWSHR